MSEESVASKFSLKILLDSGIGSNLVGIAISKDPNSWQEEVPIQIEQLSSITMMFPRTVSPSEERVKFSILIPGSISRARQLQAPNSIR